MKGKQYLPVNTIVELDDREFRVDSVNFEQGTVSLQDMTLAKEARYPIFRTEPLEYIRHLYEQADVPMEEAVEITVFTALHNAGVAYEDFSPEQMDVIYSVAESGGELEELLNPDFPPEQMQLIADVQNRTDAISRAAAEEALEPLTQQPMTPAEVNHARRQHNLPLDSGAETEQPVQPKQEPMNFRITDDDLGAGGPKTKYKANVEAIRVLQTLDAEQRQATAEEQEILSRYVGWGGIPQAFDENNAEWSKEYAELQSLLTADEYKEARASTLNAFYTSPTVIKAMYEALGNMGLSKGNVLEPSCGVGNFMGLVPNSMEKIRMYGVELDSISGRIAQQLYQKNKIAVQGFETMQFPDSFFDCVVGNVPFGNYKVPDKRYDRHNFLIHDYFIAKSLDLVRPGGVVAVVTSSGTMDKKDSSVREYLANRADLVGAIRLPNNAFQRNANTVVVADILFLQKRDRAAVERADWVDLGETSEGYSINQYFAQHPEMVLGEITTESTQYGKQEITVKLKLLKANHTSQIYSLESDIARRYPREIAVAQGQIEALKTDMEAAKPLLAQDKDHFSMEISGKVYTERKEAGAAIIEACKALKAAGTEGRIGSYGAFELHSRFDNFDKVFRLSIKGAWNYSMEVGKDPLGNILRVTNALTGIERALPQVERRLETLEQQLAQAKEEAKRPFAQEAELAEKSARLAELNSLLNMDEKGSEDALGVDEDAAETEVADRPRQPVNYAGRVAERTADNVRKPSVLAQLHAKQAERSAEPQKFQKRKSHDMEL